MLALRASAAAAVNALLKKLKARYSLKPPLGGQTDNGPEFKIQFERALDKEVKVSHGPAYSSNSQGEVEYSNKILRGVMRRLLHSQKAEPQQWSKFVPQANEIMNARPISTLNHKTAAEVLHGVLGGDDELLQSTRQAILTVATAENDRQDTLPEAAQLSGLRTWVVRGRLAMSADRPCTARVQRFRGS